MSGNLELAIRIAMKHHRYQKDAQGEPYILHPLRVMFAVRHNSDSTEDEEIAAVLHDLIEDTEYTLEGARIDFGDEVARLLDALTRRPAHWANGPHDLAVWVEEEPYPYFIGRIVKAGDSAHRIKLADIADNMGRLDGIKDEAKRARLDKKYKAALVQLWSSRGEEDEQG